MFTKTIRLLAQVTFSISNSQTRHSSQIVKLTMEMTKNDDDNSKKGVGNKLTYLGSWEVARLMA